VGGAHGLDFSFSLAEEAAMQDRMLEVFLAVAMSRTFGKAAEVLNVTSSSVSRELKGLEDELGILLVDRQKGVKSVRLTPAGESFFPLALKWQEAKKEIADSFGRQSAYFLSIAANEVASNSLLPPIFMGLLEHDPPVHLKITTDPTDMLYERIESREIDAAFVVHQEPSRFVRITPIFRDIMMIARLEEAGARDDDWRSIRPEDLDPANELYIEWSSEFRLWHDNIWDREIGRPIQLLSAHLLPKLLKRAGQWAVLPGCIRKDLRNIDIDGKRVVWYNFEGHTPTLTFYKLTHKHPKLSALKGLEILDILLRKIKPGYGRGTHNEGEEA
jgi:DNA-binding transcriptional LysR family regulator